MNTNRVTIGDNVKVKDKAIAKAEREKRIKARKERTDISRATNAEIFEYLNDIVDKIDEILSK